MIRQGLCHICGKPSVTTCPICGRPCCSLHFDRARGACTLHKTGRTITGKY